MQLTACSQSTMSLASMMPSALIDEIFNDEEEEKYPTDRFLNECIQLEGTINNNRTRNHLMGSFHSIENHDDRQVLLSQSKDISWKSWCAKKYLFFLCILFGLVSIVSIVIVVEKIQLIHNLEENLRVRHN